MKNHWLETLAELERIHEESSNGINIIKKMMNLENGSATSGDVANGRPAATRDLFEAVHHDPAGATEDSLAQRLREVFQQNPTRSFNVAELTKAAGNTSDKSVGGAIARLYKIKFAQRVSRGRYKLRRQQQPDGVSEQQA